MAPAEAVAMTREIITRHCKFDLEGPQRQPVEKYCRTDIYANLVAAWQKAAHDPDIGVTEWLFRGAPASLNVVPEHCGIFPLVHDEVVTPWRTRLQIMRASQTTLG